MPFDFLFRPVQPQLLEGDVLTVGTRQVPLRYVRKPSARRYILRVQPDGSARVTIPRGGSQHEARRFAEQQAGWIAQQLDRPRPPALRPQAWGPGTEIFFRGERVALAADPQRTAMQFADQIILLRAVDGNLRPLVERHLARLARQELTSRTFELALIHGLVLRRVTVRNQRSRWGSCSANGTISLNWRLVQTPATVRDYIILHELMHLRELNHSDRFWRWVEQVCPAYREAERWLKQNTKLLRE